MSTPAVYLLAIKDQTILPEDTKAALQKIVKDISEIGEALTAIEPTTPEAMHSVNEWVGLAMDALTRVEEMRDNLVRPLDSRLKILRQIFNPITKQLETIKVLGGGKLLQFRAMERERELRERQEFERKLREQQAEQLRREAEVRQANEAAAANALRSNKAVPIIQPDPEPPPALLPPLPAVRGVRTAGAGTSHIQVNWKVAAVDLVEVARKHPELLTLKIAESLKLRPSVAAEMEEVTLDGLRFFKEEAARFRS